MQYRQVVQSIGYIRKIRLRVGGSKSSSDLECFLILLLGDFKLIPIFMQYRQVV